MPAPLSIIIPCLNSATQLPKCLESLIEGAAEGLIKEVIIVDGGSKDDTCEIADAAGATLLTSDKGRGLQLKIGAEAAKGDWLFFLHSDSFLQTGWSPIFDAHIASASNKAGYCKLRFDSPEKAAIGLAKRANLRARWLGLPYGDQGLLISRSLYDKVGGYEALPLMEDVKLVRKLGKKRLHVLDTVITTDASKYIRDGWRKRSWRNAFILLGYLFGMSETTAAKLYGRQA